MRKVKIIIALMIMVCVVPCNAQNVVLSEDAITDSILIITQKINNLTSAIGKYYLDNVQKNPHYQDVICKTEQTFNKLSEDNLKLKGEITNANNSIKDIKDDLEWIDDLRKYYTNSPVDMLFVHSDTLSLRVHKLILGQDYPKKMDDLMKMLECANLLKQKFKKSSVDEHVQIIKGVINCSTKWKIKNLLDNYATINDEVDNWIKNEDPTLYNMMAFRKKLNENYNINIDDDYPYLAAKIRQKVTTK